jgi:MoaA/NifB/PqqE/SkfB family radical SAM enzyme
VGDELSSERIGQIVRDGKRLGLEILSIAGGEPLLRRDLEEVVRAAASAGMAVHIDTNGTMLSPARARSLRDAGTGMIAISIDGPNAAIHDTLRGVDGTFERAMAGISAASEAGIQVCANVLINRTNFDKLVDIATMLSDNGLREIKFFPVHSGHPYDYGTLDSDFTILSESEIDRLEEEIKRVKALMRSRGIVFGGDAYLKGMTSFFRGKPPRLPCMAGFLVVTVTPDGRLYACYPIESYLPIGDHRLDEIFCSPRMQEIREQVRRCRHLCWEYCYVEPSLFAHPLYAIRNARKIFNELQLYLGDNTK